MACLSGLINLSVADYYDPVDGPPFNSQSAGATPSWFIHEVKTSATATARSARTHEHCWRLISGNILEESERM
jgi:hypothetical protein